MKDYNWKIRCSGNPNKAWVCAENGARLSALMTTATAKVIVVAHNMTVNFLQNQIKEQSHE